MLDDCVWRDHDVGAAVAALPAVRSRRPILWLPAGRSAPRLPWTAGPGLVELALGPLSVRASLAAAADRTGGVPDGRLTVLVESCGGHPGLLAAVLETAQADGQILVRDGVAALANGPLSSPVITALPARDPRLTERAARPAGVVATRSEATSVKELSKETDPPLRDLAEAIAEVLDAQVFRCEGGQIEFRHRLLREAANSVVAHRARAVGRGEGGEVVASFTDVERAIILLVAQGLTNQQIASGSFCHHTRGTSMKRRVQNQDLISLPALCRFSPFTDMCPEGQSIDTPRPASSRGGPSTRCTRGRVAVPSWRRWSGTRDNLRSAQLGYPT